MSAVINMICTHSVNIAHLRNKIHHFLFFGFSQIRNKIEKKTKKLIIFFFQRHNKNKTHKHTTENDVTNHRK